MVQNARKITRSRSGKGSPASVLSGMASAAAMHTAPRMLLQATSTTDPGEGVGSQSRTRGTTSAR